MTTLLFAGGELLDQRGRNKRDLVVHHESGSIQQTGVPGSLEADRTLRIDGCVLSPGFLDLHAHLRDPGDEGVETVLSASRAAALGGFTAVIAMPDTDPPIDNAGLVTAARVGAEVALCQIAQAGCVSNAGEGVELAPMAEMVERGVTMFSDSGRGIQDAGFLRRALEYLSDLRTKEGNHVVLAQRCERMDLSVGGHMHEGDWSSELGIEGIPAQSEELMVAQSLATAALSGAAIHLQHLSTAGSFELVRRAKADGAAVTADVSPHHLLFTDEACRSFDTSFKVSPPLRTAKDVVAARAALLDGTIDAVATGHAPFASDLKERPFDQAPFGVIGLETAFAALLTHLDLPVEQLVAAMSWQPAAIAGLSNQGQRLEAGSPANLVVFDPNKTWTVDAKSMASRSSNTPFSGNAFTGKIRHTVSNGELVVENFEVTR